jgi:methylenetetrahydrofolate--tRNA-(uracil-5-)-methyltransferase
MHRNTFIDSPRLLNTDFSMRQRSGLFFAGQITGVEGYMESAASGIIAGINAARRIKGQAASVPPRETITGALCRHVGESTSADFQPMGSSFGLLPALDEKIRDKKLRYEALAQRSLELMKIYSEEVLK